MRVRRGSHLARAGNNAGGRDGCWLMGNRGAVEA